MSVQFTPPRIYEFPGESLGKPICHAREVGYQLSGDLHDATPHTIEVEEEKSIIRAVSLREQILLDANGRKPNPRDAKLPRVVQTHRYERIAAAPGRQPSVRWLVDTGCPFDLVGLQEVPPLSRQLNPRQTQCCGEFAR